MKEMSEQYMDALRGGNVGERVCAFILDNAIDGAHHKQWVLDQVLRMLGNERYSTMILVYEDLGYEWDEGIAP